MNTTLRAELVRLFPADTEWAGTSVRNIDMAVAVVRTVLTEMGCLESLGPEHKDSRKALAVAIAECFTAPVNYRRTAMVEAGIAPKMADAPKATANADKA